MADGLLWIENGPATDGRNTVARRVGGMGPERVEGSVGWIVCRTSAMIPKCVAVCKKRFSSLSAHRSLSRCYSSGCRTPLTYRRSSRGRRGFAPRRQKTPPGPTRPVLLTLLTLRDSLLDT